VIVLYPFGSKKKFVVKIKLFKNVYKLNILTEKFKKSARKPYIGWGSTPSNSLGEVPRYI